MRKIITTSLAALALAATGPVLAQDDDVSADAAAEAAEFEAAMAKLGEMFAVEPLTDEQNARLPLATTIVEKIMPEGVIQEMMGGMFDGSLGQLMELGEGSAAEQTIAENTGLSTFEIELTEAEAEEVATMFDPAWRERKAIQKAMLPDMMANMFSAMEPGMRKAMAELYAIHFSDKELQDIDDFFSTESGANFARKSFTMASDPRIVATTMEAMPVVMGSIGEMAEKQAKAEADLPPVRAFSELTAEQQERVTYLTGYEEYAEEAWGEAEEAAEEAAEAVD